MKNAVMIPADSGAIFLGISLILPPYKVEEFLFQGKLQRCITSSWHLEHQFQKSWAVDFLNNFDPVSWSEVKDASKMIYKGGAQLVAGKAKEVEKRIRNPFYISFEELFEEIRNLDETDNVQVLNFCNKNGLFTPSFPFTGEKRSVKGTDYSVEFEEMSVEPLDKFQAAIKDFKEVANLYHEYLELSKAKPKKSCAADDIYDLVVQKLNVHLKDYPVYFHAYRKDGTTYPVYYAPSLATVVWLRLYDWIVKMKNFRLCEECGDQFVPRRYDQRFCGRKCLNNNTNKVRKARRRENTREAAFQYGISEKKIKESRKK